MDVEVSHKDISNSLRNLKDFVIKNYETVTAKQVRGKMEVDMKLPEGSLKPERKYIEKLLLALIEKHIAAEGPSNRSDEQQEQDSAAANQQVSVTEPKSKPKASKPSSKPIKEQERSKPAKEQKGSKQNDQKASKQRKPSKQVKKPVEGKKEHSQAIQKMQAMCKQATINIPPGVWQKARLGEQELQTAFEELLRKHDLAQNSSAQDVERARCTLATHRDLDGIDTSNIVSRSRRAAAPRINYALAAGNVASSDDSEADEEGSASDADSGLSEPAVDAEEGPGNRSSHPSGASKPRVPSSGSSDDDKLQGSDEKGEPDPSRLSHSRHKGAEEQSARRADSPKEESVPKRRRGVAALGSSDDDDDDFAPKAKKAAGPAEQPQSPQNTPASTDPAGSAAAHLPTDPAAAAVIPVGEGTVTAAEPAAAPAVAAVQNGIQDIADAAMSNEARPDCAGGEGVSPCDPLKADGQAVCTAPGSDIRDSSPPANGRRTFTLDSDDE